MTTATGSFSAEFAATKNWKLDENLCQALLAVLERPEHGQPPRRVIDFGAGVGRYVEMLNDRGFKAIGLDGVPNIVKLSEGRVLYADLTQSLFPVVLNSPAEYGICIEVGEHVPPELADRLLDNLAVHAPILKRFVVSWATIGQRGRGHCNCHSPEWVACEFGRRGWTLNEEATAEARARGKKGWNRKLLVFDKRSSS